MFLESFNYKHMIPYFDIIWYIALFVLHENFIKKKLKANDTIWVMLLVLLARSRKNICSSNGGTEEKGKTEWNSVCHQNCWRQLVWVPVILLCKIFIPSYVFDALLLCWNWPFSPPNNSRTSWIITLLFTFTFVSFPYPSIGYYHEKKRTKAKKNAGL